MELPRYSFRLKKEDVQIQKRIEQGIKDNPKLKSSEIIRELMYTAIKAENSPQSIPFVQSTGVTTDEVKELKTLILQMIEKQNQMANELTALKKQVIERQPITTSSTEVTSNENAEIIEKEKAEVLEVSEKEEEVGNMALDFFDQW